MNVVLLLPNTSHTIYPDSNVHFRLVRSNGDTISYVTPRFSEGCQILWNGEFYAFCPLSFRFYELATNPNHLFIFPNTLCDLHPNERANPNYPLTINLVGKNGAYTECSSDDVPLGRPFLWDGENILIRTMPHNGIVGDVDIEETP